MTPIITAFDWVPPFARGLVRDLRARWALEEAGRRYDVRYLKLGEQKEAAHRRLQPFGQLPTYEEGGVTIFESGAIVLHIAADSEALLPRDPAARASATAWAIAALNSIEPMIFDWQMATTFEPDAPWSAQRLPSIEERLGERLGELADALDEREWLDGAFTAGDLMMVSVLRQLEGERPLVRHGPLVRYVQRGTARPAFQRALAAQMAGFTGVPPVEFEQAAETR